MEGLRNAYTSNSCQFVHSKLEMVSSKQLATSQNSGWYTGHRPLTSSLQQHSSVPKPSRKARKTQNDKAQTQNTPTSTSRVKHKHSLQGRVSPFKQSPQDKSKPRTKTPQKSRSDSKPRSLKKKKIKAINLLQSLNVGDSVISYQLLQKETENGKQSLENKLQLIFKRTAETLLLYEKNYEGMQKENAEVKLKLNGALTYIKQLERKVKSRTDIFQRRLNGS